MLVANEVPYLEGVRDFVVWGVVQDETRVRHVLDVRTGKLDNESQKGVQVTAVHYDTYSDARSHLKDLLDAAATGRPATVRRESTQAAVVDAARLRSALVRLIPSRAEVVAEDDGWSAMLPGLPIAADGGSFEEAVEDLVRALREYAEDWNDHLLTAPNHRSNWGLVQLIGLSTDAQLREWVLGSGA